MARGAALFVTEFGMTTSSGSGTIDSAETVTWMQFMSDNGISWCNWSVSDKDETSAALKPGASGTGGWPMSSISISGQWIRNKIRTGNAALVTGVPAVSGLPLQFQLHQNYPNPFNPSTTIHYEVAVAGSVTITVYDVLGRQLGCVGRVQWHIFLSDEGWDVYRREAAGCCEIVSGDTKDHLIHTNNE
jgi:hypothetical protein